MAKRKAPGAPVKRKTAAKSSKTSSAAARRARKAPRASARRAASARVPKKAKKPARPARRPAVARKAKKSATVVRPKSKRPAPQPRKTVRAARPDSERPTTPPSSLNLNRRGSAVRTGRAEIAQSLAEHATMSPAIVGGDVDANIESAYFSGDEAPGGDNPTPDQDVVDEIGKALGVEYQDSEELHPEDKVAARDKHRWELDPASSEDYRDRKS